jgi:hypothetical protein
MMLVDPYRFGTFNPLTGWTTDPVHAVWASDPSWTPPADGGAVSSWRNGGSVGGDLVQATGSKQPTYDASLGAYNNQPVVTFATDDVLAVNLADIAQPYYLVVIGNVAAATANMAFVGVGGNAAYRVGTDSATGAQWRWVPGSGIQGGTVDTGPHLFVAAADGANGFLEIDGASVAIGNVGTNALTVLSVGAGVGAFVGSHAVYLNGSIAYAAVFNTDPTGQAEWADFKAWCLSFYGIAVAP